MWGLPLTLSLELQPDRPKRLPGCGEAYSHYDSLGQSYDVILARQSHDSLLFY